jgi:aromatic ring-cleaving dioxygenase
MALPLHEISFFYMLIVVLSNEVRGYVQGGTDPALANPVGDNNQTCDGEPPMIVSYHVHAVWDGANETATNLALKKWGEFSMAMKKEGLLYDGGDCPFSHPNGTGGGFKEICPFIFNQEGPFQPWTAHGLFGGSNFAFFIPNSLYMRAMNWWRQRHDGLWYMLHVNTGCEDYDHTVWSLKSLDYPDFQQTKTGLWCCHAGPPGCSCDITQYAQYNSATDQPSNCIASTESGSIVLSTECDGDDWNLGTWRETTYTTHLKQIEIYNDTNVFLCLGIEDGVCASGAAVSLVDCGGVDSTSSRMHWDSSKNQLKSDSCPGLCVDVGVNDNTKSSILTFQPCVETNEWNRIYLD